MFQQNGIYDGEAAPGSREACTPVVKPFGDCAILVEFGQVICAETQALVHRLDAAIASDPMAGFVEAIPAYTSLAVVFDPLVTTVDAVTAEVLARLPRARPAGGVARTWQVPVAYGGLYGPDLDDHAAHCGLSAHALISAHASVDYTIAMFGFLPGFAYLSGLPAELARPRRPTPRPKAAPGIIAIGGAQTAIGSLEGPSGWHIIGQTPFRAFDIERTPATVLEVGDQVQFVPIPHDWFPELAAAAAAGELVAEVTR